MRSFTKSLFISVGGVFIIFVTSFALYQYHREKEYKTDILHSKLQTYCYEMEHTLDEHLTDSTAFHEYVDSHSMEGIRVTIVDERGRVVIDSNRDAAKMNNHKERKEIKDALSKGEGYDIMRASETLNATYFYSATYFKNRKLIVRVAVPYNAKLAHSLEADNMYLYYAAGISILLGFVLYRNTRRIGKHISYLRSFAMKAEKGEPLDKELQAKVPDDELGDISHTIITLYWKLKHSEEDKVRLKRQLTQNAAHELKTPAASIQGYLETIMNNPDLQPEKRRHFIERCYAQSVRMSKLLLDMSTLTRLDELENRFTNTVDVVPIIRNTIDDVQLQLNEKGITINLDCPQNAVIRGDASLVYSIFRNILDNTIAYAWGANRMSITCRKEGKYYAFTLSDNGQGVEPQHLPHLFERFYRVDKGRSRKLGGTGLGLAIVKNAVILHGGSVSAELTPGGGLTISLRMRAED